MNTTTHTLVQKLWNYCSVLRDDGMSYGDYVEQLTYLLFLKMADEQSKAPWNRPSPVPAGLDWQSLLDCDGEELEAQYLHILRELGTPTHIGENGQGLVLKLAINISLAVQMLAFSEGVVLAERRSASVGPT